MQLAERAHELGALAEVLAADDGGGLDGADGGGGGGEAEDFVVGGGEEGTLGRQERHIDLMRVSGSLDDCGGCFGA